jgi:hypothetical protein
MHSWASTTEALNGNKQRINTWTRAATSLVHSDSLVAAPPLLVCSLLGALVHSVSLVAAPALLVCSLLGVDTLSDLTAQT